MVNALDNSKRPHVDLYKKYRPDNTKSDPDTLKRMDDFRVEKCILSCQYLQHINTIGDLVKIETN